MRKAKAIFPLLVLVVCASSCLEEAEFAAGDCVPFVYGHRDSNGNLDPCCTDKSSPCPGEVTPAPNKCDGECMPTNANQSWSKDPVQFWYGDYELAPMECPDMTENYWAGYAEPTAVHECPDQCVCSDPACVLPASVTASGTVGCNGPFTDFPVASNGMCSMGDIKPNTLKSLGILSPTVSACTPSAVPITVPKDGTFVTWSKRGVVCSGSGFGVCEDRGDVCVPPATSGFKQCLANLTKGDELSDCPAGKYTHKYVVYDRIDDNVACTPCKCGTPMGSTCTAAVSAFQDISCTTPIFKDYVVPLGSPQCATIAPNLPLQGVTANWITNQPSTCAPSGGDPTGKVDVDHSTARAFCCLE